MSDMRSSAEKLPENIFFSLKRNGNVDESDDPGDLP